MAPLAVIGVQAGISFHKHPWLPFGQLFGLAVLVTFYSLSILYIVEHMSPGPSRDALGPSLFQGLFAEAHAQSLPARGDSGGRNT